MATSHSATIDDEVLEDGSEKGGTPEEIEKPLLAYRPEEEMLLWKNQSPVVLWQLQLFLDALMAAHDEAEDSVYKAQRKAVLKIEMGVIRDGNMGEALQAAFDRVQIALIENMTRNLPSGKSMGPHLPTFNISSAALISQQSNCNRPNTLDPRPFRALRTKQAHALYVVQIVEHQTFDDGRLSRCTSPSNRPIASWLPKRPANPLTYHQGNGHPPTNTPTSEGISAQDIAAVTKIVSVALEHLDTREVEEQPKTAEDYQILLKKKEELMTLYNRVLQVLSFTRLRREGESQVPTIETVDELGTGYSTLLRGVESVLARVIVWIEEYEHDNGINTGVSGSSSARTP
ncbi:hypothetical protein CNYM01_05147 [Colletotrichum nymphaeae SA-01]|uniref:Uncharacterized protein n=1 Tax=Colletotrichum nymphaeae SA-01 TaxID=1460502 RepID=A0A135TX95_9PEZI|nr:hypothetical protein CNYM01_05147 [Colletotrichum nymphaeae SA-01]